MHLFVDCESIRPLWKQITDELLQPYGIKSLSNKDILLGILVEKQNNVINHIIMEAKYYIYACKLEKCFPTYKRLINRLKITESIEREIAWKSERKNTVHIHKWHHLMEYIAPQKSRYQEDNIKPSFSLLRLIMLAKLIQSIILYYCINVIHINTSSLSLPIVK